MPTDERANSDFPVVGVGASAGGLDAYRQLLRSLPSDTGVAFVFIQHLDPNHESMMAELLSRYTSMPVRQAEDDMALRPDTVYIIPPNKFMRLVDHGLFLDEPVKERGIRMSIDYFFRSMAEVRGEKSIAILLSGTGSDGTLGIREIKASGGMVMVQQPDTAEYDGMPRSAIASGCVDFVLPVPDMPETLTNYLRHPYLDNKHRVNHLSEDNSDGFNSILSLLRTHTNYDFRSYKKGTLERRIQRRMGLLQLSSIDDYVKHARERSEEINLLFRDLLIGVTRFFREPNAWDTLRREVISKVIQNKEPGQPLRAWVSGCSSGEEAYTLAMCFFSELDRARKTIDVQVFATDLNEEAIVTARAGSYPSAIAADVPEEYLKKYFNEDGERLRVNKRLRDSVVFATQNVISDPPFSKLDIITCRNLMIYLEADIQQRLIEMFHFALAEDRYLFLGSSESGDRPGRLFEAISKSERIYRRKSTPRIRHGSFPIIPSRERPPARQDGHSDDGYLAGVELAKKVLLDRFVPASVLVNRRLEVQYYHGPVRNYLDFPTGEPSIDLTTIAIDKLRSKLRTVLNRVLNEEQPADSVAYNVPRNGSNVSVSIRAEPVMNPTGGGPNILVFFNDVSEPKDHKELAKAREQARKDATLEDASLVAQLEYELQATREDLQSTIEEMETANEELKASNEEVMSMNEELQSTNEELETSREELQSLNEELSTVNTQLEEKINEVEATSNDLFNLLRSTEIATIFLDTDLRIRRFTPATRQILRIIDSDIGRPIDDLAPRVNDPELLADAQLVLEKLQPIEIDVQSGDGRYFIRRALPYRTSENKIEGVVVTLTDVTSVREAGERASRRERQQEAVAELGRQALAGVDVQSLLERAVADIARHLNVDLVKFLKLLPDKQGFLLRAGVGWNEGLIGSAVVSTDMTSQAGYTLQRATPVVVDDFSEEKRFSIPDLLREHDVTCGASVIVGPITAPWGVLGAHERTIGKCGFTIDDVNFLQAMANTIWLAIVQVRAREEHEAERRELLQLTDGIPYQMSVISSDERYILTNAAYEEWGFNPEELEGKRVVELLGQEAYDRVSPLMKKALAGEMQQFELPVRMPDQPERINLVTYAPRLDADGKPDGIYSLAVDITAQKNFERRLAESEAQYRLIGESIPFGVWICDPDGKLVYVSPSFLDLVGQTFEDARAFGWADALAPGTAEDTLEAWEECRRAGANWEREHEFRGKDGQSYTVLSLGRPVRDDDGRISSWVGLNLDITERKQEEKRIKIISAELDHRVKNILATVSSVARLTGRSSTSLEDYRDNLEARIQSMAQAHSALAAGNWNGLDLHTLLEQELGPYQTKHNTQLQIDGPMVVLSPTAVQSMTLAIHELTTNAAKYGALSQPTGQLSINWKLQEKSAPRLCMVWHEAGLSGIEPPTRHGFGSTVIRQIVRDQLNATVDMEFFPSGLLCKIELPPQHIVWN